MLRLIVAAVVVSLAGCGGGGGGDTAIYLPPPCKAVSVGGSLTTQTLTISEPTDLTIGGTLNTVYIEGTSNICSLVVDGSIDLVQFNVPITVDACTLGGTSNSIYRPTSMALTCTDTGAGNSLYTY